MVEPVPNTIDIVVFGFKGVFFGSLDPSRVA